MNSLATRRQTRFISSTTKLGNFKQKILKFLKISLIICLVLTMLALVLLLKPRKIICVYTDHTYCEESISQKLTPLQSRPWWQWWFKFPDIKKQIIQQETEIVELKWRPNFSGQAEITITKAKILFPFTQGEQNFLFLSNQQTIEQEKPGSPVFIFSSNYQNFSNTQIENLTLLYHQLKKISPRVTRIELTDIQNIKVKVENNPEFLLKADSLNAINSQVSTLQAFLRSSTMEKDYHLIDLRFEGQLIIKN